MRRLITAGVLAASCLLAACSTSSSGSSGTSTGTSSGPSGTLTIDNESGGLWTCNFNPFNPNDVSLSFGPVYEPLMFVNTLQNAKVTPWLATSSSWGAGDKTLTFTIRDGVKFSNGTPMTADDVVFTFNMLKQHSELDGFGIWTVMTSIAKQGSNQVVMTFKYSGATYFYYIADQTPIVPRAIWSKIADPLKYPDTSPVGTGAYTVGRCSQQNIAYAANKSYYVPGEPHIATVNYPSFLTNDTANTWLANGQAQWGSQYIPSIQQYYLDKSPNYHYWFPAFANVSIFPNLKNPILANLAVRKAMAYAINRNQAAQIGEYGYEPPGNQTGIVTPTFTSWLDTSQAATFDNNYAYNPAKAISILTAAGFHKGSDGIMVNAGGQKLSFTLLNNSGYSDWVNAANIVINNLKAVGISVTQQGLEQSAYQTALYNGQYQLAYGSEQSTGPSPYYEMRDILFSGGSAAIGQTAITNWERYSDPATDALLSSFALASDPAQERSIMSKLQRVMLEQIPVIPVTGSVAWYQYDTGSFTGWVTQQNPYALPAVFNFPDWGQMLLNLAPKK